MGVVTRRSMLSLAAAAATPGRRLGFQRGVNYTAEWPDTYSSARARQILESLPRYGVNAVAFVPYGFTRRGQVDVRFLGARSWEKDEAIAHLASVAHQVGLKVFLKPQIWIPQSAPSDLLFDREDDRHRWFLAYRKFLEHYAGLAVKIRAELFSTGVEFSRLSADEAQWRALIACARKIYSGAITYCANWGQEFESIRFWDAVDYIGLNNYYPLPDSLATEAIVEKVEQVHRRFQKPVIFAEAGFASLENPHRQPWDETPRKIALQAQARCYDAVFRGFYHKPWFHGVYWWKVGTNGFGGPQDGSHTPWGKPAMRVVERWYKHGGR